MHYLISKQSVSQNNLLKIWKGLSLSFWFSDSLFLQADIADRLSILLLRMHPKLALPYFTCFFEFMRREWSRIDKLRLDKYMMLVRKLVQSMFELLSRENWSYPIVCRYFKPLVESILINFRSCENCSAYGFSYHLCDIFLPEMTRKCHKFNLQLPRGILVYSLQPFLQILLFLPSRRHPFINRCKEGIFDTLIDIALTMSSLDIEAIKFRSMRKMFSIFCIIVADSDISQCARRTLYSFTTALRRAMIRLNAE